MSNRYLDEAGEITSKQIDTTIKDRTDALGFFKLMGIKDVTTKRQKKNGTTVYELPMQKLYYSGSSQKYKYAIYDSGYIRDVSEHCHSPWYINKSYITTTKYWNKYYKDYTTYKGRKPAFIHDFDSQLVYLANYILKNRYNKGKIYSCCDYTIEQMKECSNFRHEVRWGGDTVTIPSDEYAAMVAEIDVNKLEEISSKSSVRDTVSIPRDAYIKFKKAYDREGDDIQVIINGTRYNLS